MSNEDQWRWADPAGQQRLVRTDELRAALASGAIPSNAPVWRAGWPTWRSAEEVPELQSSALAAQNGLLPNIPPPPSFVVAAQSDFEGAPPANVAAVTEPPAPPRYQAAVAAKTRASANVSPKPALVRLPEKQPLQRTASPVKPAAALPKAVVGPPPPLPKDKPRVALLPSEPPTMPDLGWDDVSVPSDANTVVNDVLTESKARMALEAAPSQPALPTMMGVPAIKRTELNKRVITPVNMPAPPPRTLPPKAHQLLPPPEPAVVALPPQKPTSIPPPKRPTLMLYGGAPGDAPDSSAQGAPSAPIVVPPPEPSGATKNMVTRPPPWSEGAAQIASNMTKQPPRALPDAAEELSGSLLLSEPSSPDLAGYRREELSGSDLRSDSDIQVVKPPPLNPSPPVTTHPLRPMSTMMGMAPPHVQSTPPPTPTTVRPPKEAPRDVEVPPDNPSHARAFDLEAILRDRPKWQLAAFGAVGVLVMLGMVGVIVHALAEPKDQPVEVASASASASAPPTPLSAAPIPTPTPTSKTPVLAAFIPVCATAGVSHVIAPKAVVGSGVEVHTAASGIALGFATSPKDGVVMVVDPSTMAAASSLKPHTLEAIKRVQAGAGEKLTSVVDFDKKGDALQGRRAVIGPSLYDVGAESGGLAYALPGTDKSTKLFDLPNTDPVEALRGAPIPSGSGFVIAMRQGKAVVFGAVTGDPPAPKGTLGRIAAIGAQVGSPSIAANDSVAMVAWAEKSEGWSLRLARFALGQAPDPAQGIAFDLPAGGLGEQALSPSVATLPGGAFLLVWTEGPTSNHQVRAMVIDDHGKPAGSAFTISDEGVNAGQGQAAVLADGKGVVAFLASGAAKSFQVAATPIDCHVK